MNSMTKEELEDPEIVTGSRVERIAKGSGCSVSDVRDLLKQYKQSKKLAKMLKSAGAGSPRDMQKMMKQFKGKLPF